MRSIRWCLVVYFVGLLSLALGGASWLVYHSARATLEDKQSAVLDLLKNRYETRCSEERDSLDQALLQQALALAGRVQIEVDWSSARYRSYHVLGFLTAPGMPYGPLTTLPWLCQMPHRLTPRPSPGMLAAWEIWKLGGVSVKLNESELIVPTTPLEDQLFYQIDTNEPFARPLRSSSLLDASFPVSEHFAEDRAFYWESDTLSLWPGEEVRRVRVKTSSARRRFVPLVRNRDTEPRVGPPAPASRPSAEPRPPLSLTLQVATRMTRLNERLQEIAEQYATETAAVREETSEALSRLQFRLATVACITFLATLVGTFWLVWLGLLPLRRLSEAVSRVSPRDFRLPLEERSLPTELNPIASKLAGTLAALKQAFTREKQAIGDISHELRTPLAAILMTTELALRKPRSVEEYREMLGDCRASAQQMNQIIERMLTLARLDAGVAQVRPQRVNAAELAQQCAAVVRPIAESAGLQLHFESDTKSNETEITTDPDKLREIINNLLHNAVQYNKPHGQIRLSVARDQSRVRVEVEDTGIGIEPASLDHIFERFYRADPSRHSDGLNAGLGLAIVREYVELMSGTIEVSSTLGQGTRFRVELPLQIAQGV
ncbi:MAG: ATP-binding protein [Gemmataceae bacterium]